MRAKAVLLALLWTFSGTVYAQFSVANFASGRGIVAPGAVAEIRGSDFSADSYYTNQLGELPTDMGGVQVAFAKQFAGIRIVTPERIVCVVPDDVPTGWQRVDILTPGGNYHGWAVIAHVAPGIVIEDGHPQGLWRLGQTVDVIRGNALSPGVSVVLTATGFAGAKDVTAYVSASDQCLVVPARVVPLPISLVGLEWVGLDLPLSLRGEIEITFAADGFLSNTVNLTIQ
ncbi:MAG TPA: hypothetical protein PKC13_28830 [Blastocatellia bacterium]|nr:hypothetical protein [Blastocatellia bacterium]HMV87920.1 hypothetical protein [Blastocatellia bacterium]HMX29625.1 hypothetical protein [Blastocatellia bacterium]HMY73874.1 hypothetical protein [Blastocatellia bacterium]